MDVDRLLPGERLTTGERGKLQRRLDKIHRILARRGDLQMHATVSRQRRIVNVEVTLRALRHTLVVAGHGPATFVAAHSALDKLEKQVLRNKRKIIDMHRPGRQRDEPVLPVAASIADSALEPAEEERHSGLRIVGPARFEVKPMSAAGALLALEDSPRDYIAYRDADTDAVNVLIRQGGGTVVLVEGD